MEESASDSPPPSSFHFVESFIPFNRELIKVLIQIPDIFGRGYTGLPQAVVETFTMRDDTSDVQQALLGRLYGLSAAGKIDSAIDELFSWVDEALCRNDYGACDLLLARANLSMLTSDLIVGLLTITAAAKDRLPKRDELKQRALAELERQKGPDYAARLMKRIR
jgi:hypothetical protein